MNTKQTTKGFTIIEVVLVLAIAGLIFLMVFVALPALQRGQRDSARKNDVGTVATAVTTYTSNNRGNFPTSAKLASYITDKSANTSSVTVDSYSASITVADGEIIVVKGARCSDTGTTSQSLTAGTSNQFVVITHLEAGGGTTFCQDS